MTDKEKLAYELIRTAKELIATKVNNFLKLDESGYTKAVMKEIAKKLDGKVKGNDVFFIYNQSEFSIEFEESKIIHGGIMTDVTIYRVVEGKKRYFQVNRHSAEIKDDIILVANEMLKGIMHSLKQA